MKITLSAYAKINLNLGIVGRRSDGYHLIQSVMQKISLADTVTLEPRSHGITIQCNRTSVPINEKNLCYRAADAYRKAAGIQDGVKIDLQLSVPDMAGLGAGSADAAGSARDERDFLFHECSFALTDVPPAGMINLLHYIA